MNIGPKTRRIVGKWRIFGSKNLLTQASVRIFRGQLYVLDKVTIKNCTRGSELPAHIQKKGEVDCPLYQWSSANGSGPGLMSFYQSCNRLPKNGTRGSSTSVHFWKKRTTGFFISRGLLQTVLYQQV
jgi:hypothetical protein